MSKTKIKILDAASALFLEGGASALSVRAIAKRAGLSTIGIYSHFNGKQGILDALYIEGFGYVSKAVKAEQVEADPKAEIIAATRRYIKMAVEHRAHYKLIFGEGASNYLPSDDAKQAGRDSFDLLVEHSSRAMPEVANLAERRRFALGIWALIHGFISLQHHAVSNIVNTKKWHEMILQAMTVYVDAQLKAFRSPAAR
ncbi:MAG: TetR family transcriptional regulator [Kordiimonadales bacterium]|nr:MAG: TetR family transcriptional regulator [Kordiimonadales bacterium]